MAHTLALNLVHCVFSTKHRENLIRNPEKLWNYSRGIGRNTGVNVLCVGGTQNHVHLLIGIPPTRNIADIIRDLKANSSRELNETAHFAWQDGYAAISVSPSLVAKVTAYIAGQEDHHRVHSFEEEYRAIADRIGMPYAPEYLLG
jgi:putative transposase